MAHRAAIRIALACFLALGVVAPARAAFLPLPASGAQVNDDPANSIDPMQDAGTVDTAGGTVTAGNLQVPWATFEQKVGTSQQIFVRAFKNGAWVTQGFPASLNLTTTVIAEEPQIDFAGPGRAVPWVTWYEPNANFGPPTNIFASRFNATAGLWLPSGQDRAGGAMIPSLNIHTNRTAENPSVAGGATVAGNDPVPWVTWDENDGVATDVTPRQIFVSKGVKQATAGVACTGATKPAGGNNVNGFCWQQVGLDRLAATSPTSDANGDPTLNIDPTRSGVEPDIAFTGMGDTVAWVVWYEEDTSAISPRGNKMVFAAKIVADAAADGGFHWLAVGNGTAGQTNVLNTAGVHGFGPCAESQAAEDACTLNKVAANNAENPRVAAGTLVAGNPTVPWVVWQEDIGGGTHAIFVSRLVGGDHFELFNNQQPISNTVNDATRPDITFSGNVPYITWQEQIAGVLVTFAGHFEGGASAPVFKLDTPTGIPNSGFTDVLNPQRAPVSSTCTANPTNADGATCQAGAAGTPFFLYTAGGPGTKKLFAQAYAPSEVTTLAATNVMVTDATLHGSANPGGAAINTHFDFGPDTNYGTSTTRDRVPAGSIVTSFATTATGLPEGTTVHFRAVAQSDFVSLPGGDQMFTLVNGPPSVSIDNLPNKVKLRKLKHGRTLSVDLTISEPATVTLAIVNKKGKVLRHTTVNQATAGSFTASIKLKGLRGGKLTLRVTATDAQGASDSVEQQFRAVG